MAHGPGTDKLLVALERSRHSRVLSIPNFGVTSLPALPPNLIQLYCPGNQLTSLPALPPRMAAVDFQNNPIDRVTLPFPPYLHHLGMQAVFAGTRLYLPNVTLRDYPEALRKYQARGVRNARLVGEYANLPHGVESLIASNLSGIEGKNAAQQGDILARRTGIDRKGYSGGRTRRGRKSRRKSLRHRK